MNLYLIDQLNLLALLIPVSTCCASESETLETSSKYILRSPLHLQFQFCSVKSNIDFWQIENYLSYSDATF